VVAFRLHPSAEDIINWIFFDHLVRAWRLGWSLALPQALRLGEAPVEPGAKTNNVLENAANMSETEQKVCPRCGERFECRLSAGCWCAEYPAVSHVEPQSDCLCPKCLKKACEREKEGSTPQN